MKFWQGKTVVVTGHTGFKGSWLALWLHSLGANLIGFSLPAHTGPNLFKMTQLNKEIVNIFADIRNFSVLQQVIKKYQPEIIIHMAAQSLVRQAYQTPFETYSTNIMGTVNLFEAARSENTVKVVINVTSDKCYEQSGLNKVFREEDRLGGYDPYSNSKACSELITQSYRDVFFKQRGIGIATARAGNVIGGGDWASERLVPDILKACMEQENALLRYPNALRPWQHVLQPLYGYLVLAEKLYMSPDVYAESWNFGPPLENIKSVSWVADYLIKIFGSSIKWVKDETQHWHEASILQLDSSKSEKHLGWLQIWNLEKGLEKTVDWFQAYQSGENMQNKTMAQINQFSEERQAREKNRIKEIFHV